MADSLHFGIVSEIDAARDYSQFNNLKEICRAHQCIEIPDQYAARWIADSESLASFVCTLQRPFKGIDYCGVTLIPAESLPQLLDIIWLDSEREKAVSNLIALIQRAIQNGNFMIVYGV